MMVHVLVGQLQWTLSYHQKGPAVKVFHFPSLELEMTTEENGMGRSNLRVKELGYRLDIIYLV